MKVAAATVLALLLGGMAAAAEETALSARRPGLPPVALRAEASETAWVVRVLDAAGQEVQRVEVQSDALESGVGLEDADGDGAADLWIPVMTGNANTAYEIWRMTPAQGRFVRAGEVSGVDFRRDGPYFVALGRNGCCGAEAEFFRFPAGGGMARAFMIALAFNERGRVERCGVDPGTERPSEALRRRWCSGPGAGTRLR